MIGDAAAPVKRPYRRAAGGVKLARMDAFDWIAGQWWVVAVVTVVTVYLLAMARMADREPREAPPKPDSLAGYDVEWCGTCSIWVPAKAPWCGVKGCARPHRTL